MMNKNSHQAIEEKKEAEFSLLNSDINVMDDVKELRKLFLKELIIVWYHPQANSENLRDYAKQLKQISTLKTFDNWNNAFDFIEKTVSPCIIINSVDVITENLIKTICQKTQVISVNILYNNAGSVNEWTQKHKKILSAESNFQAIIDKVGEQASKWQKKESSLRFDFPIFSPIFDDFDKSENTYLNVYLTQLTKFGNRSQSQADFIALAKAVYSEDSSIEEFGRQYHNYDMKNVFAWYTKESFFYKLLNNSLRIAKPDTIFYCRLILKDLEAAIKECHQKKSKDFNGLLYRGAIISDEDWKRLEQNQGKEIEMHGFMSTSTNPDIAEAFAAMGCKDKQTLFTVIVPTIPDERGQGFAELDEFSQNAGENEVLFNIRSRFRILEVGSKEIDRTKFRHVVLLYVARDLRSFMRFQHPVIPIDLKEKKCFQCCSCNIDIEPVKSSIFVNLGNTEEIFCYNCIQSAQDLNIMALAGLKTSSRLDVKVEGMVIKYTKKLEIPFHGYKCKSCNNSDIKRFMKCQECKTENKHWCNNCFGEDNSCLCANHVIIIENQPYTFWSEKMTVDEAVNMAAKRQYDNQGKVLESTHNYGKAKEYYEKWLALNKSKDDEDTAVVYMRLGLLHRELRELEKANVYILKALKLFETIHEAKALSTSICYSHLAVIYMEQGKLEQAEQGLLSLSAVYEKNYKDKSSYIAGTYNNLGMTYERQGHFEKALEYQLKALSKYKEMHGDINIELAGCSNNIGSIYGRLGDAKKAMDYHSQALRARKAIYGDKHPETIHSYNNVGILYGELGEIEKGIEYIENSLRISKMIYGEKDSLAAMCYNNLGTLYNKNSLKRDLHKAKYYFEKALEVRHQVYGEQHFETAVSYDNLGVVYKGLGMFKESLEYHLKAIKIRENHFGRDHPDTANSYYNIGALYLEIKELNQAERYLSDALKIFKNKYGLVNLLVAQSCRTLAVLFQNMKQLDRALPHLTSAIQIYEKLNNNKKDSLANLADLYKKLGIAFYSLQNMEKAKEYYSKAIDTMWKTYDGLHIELANSYHLLADTYMKLNEFSNAFEAVSNAYAIRIELKADKDPDTKLCLDGIKFLIQNYGKELQGEALQRESDSKKKKNKKKKKK